VTFARLMGGLRLDTLSRVVESWTPIVPMSSLKQTAMSWLHGDQTAQ